MAKRNDAEDNRLRLELRMPGELYDTLLRAAKVLNTPINRLAQRLIKEGLAKEIRAEPPMITRVRRFEVTNGQIAQPEARTLRFYYDKMQAADVKLKPFIEAEWNGDSQALAVLFVDGVEPEIVFGHDITRGCWNFNVSWLEPTDG